MKLLLALALLASSPASPPAALQTQWVRIGNSGMVEIQIDPASYRVEGSKAHFRARLRSQTSGRALIRNYTLDCGANTIQEVGPTQFYAGETFERTVASDETVKHAESHGVGGPAYRYICKGER